MTFRRYQLAALAILVVVAAAGFFAYGRSTQPATNEPVVAGFSISVDLSARELSVIENGAVTATYPVAVGRPSYPTPKGRFAVHRIVWNPRWVPPDSPWARKKRETPPGDPANPMGKVKIFFEEPDYYIHGTREVDSLGQAESHGCLRMRNADVVALAQQIMAAGGKPVSQSWVHRLINRIRSTREVRLSSGVPIEIHG